MQQAIAPARHHWSLSLSGLSCGHCVQRTRQGIEAADPAASITTLDKTRLEIDTVLGRQELIATVEAAGYHARPVHEDELSKEPAAPAQPACGHGGMTEGDERSSMRREFEIEGMTCASCVSRVERALGRVSGVAHAYVNLASERATVELDAKVDDASLIRAVQDAGYSAKPLTANASEHQEARQREEQRSLHRALLLATVLSLPIVVLEMGGHLIPGLNDLLVATVGQHNLWLLQAILATLVLAGPGRRFFRQGIPALLRAAPDMHSLVAVGTGAAYLYSLISTLQPGWLPAGTANVYFEAAAVIVTLILLGRYLEIRARGRTSSAIRHLIGLRPRQGRIERDGVVTMLPIDQIETGMRVLVQPGERIPVDGVVLEGESFVDESMLSGEPMPIAKRAGERLAAGTLNQRGALIFRATEVGEGTLLAQIVRMVEEAQGAKLPVQALVDRVTLWFVPAVMGVALLTFFAWLLLAPAPSLGLAVVNAVAVLIIACPCAMGLATPTSIMVGTGRAAQLGVLLRRGEALQRLRNVRVVALDKTGTLTEGRPALTELEIVEGIDEARLLADLATVEVRSEHPIAQAIVAAAEARGLRRGTLERFESLTGLGVTAQVDGREIAIGTGRLLAKLGIDPAALDARATQLAETGKTPLFAAVDGRLAGVLAVSDPLKPSSREAIDGLHAHGIKVALVSGDNRRTCEAIAAQLGIDEVIAEVLPGGKVAAVERLRQRMGSITFVGDGINDAPALASADVGVAMGSGTDIAIESADVVLVNGQPRGILRAIEISRAVMRNIAQNLFWAFAYNVALIPVAAGVLTLFGGPLLSPELAAGAMALSSVFVLANALRLRRAAA
ncbi:heavy metal translocating P-type ATPase [Halotalea alkalilenta]|uniref:P-type Cu(+) transporter n=1 Tax=Halotalea alkalilenta TaxID=376489 RepID=A0A172YJ56_9GAMM|nr:heavy metal translocating P-type ATPase [Halotalea alkalilenta]ANF59261.1 ATPase [Halotalea alkalilenta]